MFDLEELYFIRIRWVDFDKNPVKKISLKKNKMVLKCWNQFRTSSPKKDFRKPRYYIDYNSVYLPRSTSFEMIWWALVDIVSR